MEIAVKIEGLDKLSANLTQVRASIEKELTGAIRSAAEKVRGEAIQSILEGSKSGRVYKRGNVTHRASAPGEAPASDTGRLASSIQVIQTGLESLVIAGRGQVKYARFLEFGTSKMAERPFMIPALEKSRAWITTRLQKAVKDGVKKVKP